MFQVLGPSASPVKKIILPSSSPDQIGRYMQRPLDDHFYITKSMASTASHSLPTPRHKVRRPRKNKAGIIAIVPPADSALRLPSAAGPQTPPPTASRAHHDPLRAQIPATPQSNQRRTTGNKTVPCAFVTPQSSSRQHSVDLSLSSDRPWPSSSPLTSPGGNGLGIFVNHPNQPPHDVDPSMIHPDQNEVQAVNKYSTYTTLFRSPIQYPPYLGQRSLSNFEALSSSAMYGNERKRARTRTRTRTGENGKSLSPTIAKQPQTPPSIICFAISETGQAVIECKESPATPESRSRVLSSSTSISTVSSSTSASVSVSDDREADGVSEAETEIFDPKRDLMLHSDARVAMAKVIRRQQALLRRYREQMVIREPQNGDNSEQSGKHQRIHHSRNWKRHIVSGDVVPSEKPRTSQMDVANSRPMPDRQTQSSPLVRHQEPFASPRLAGVHEQQQQQQPQAQQMQSQAEEAQKVLPKRKRGRPPKNQQQQFKRQGDDGITRCVCGHNDFFGTPMVQCDSCTHWLHMPCVNLDPRVPIVGAWYCPLCTCGVAAGA
ncbi:hypothetical protein V1520DRAFT_273225 [Lipomyces starkeyi]|uniref:PHD-type domain-containing protein n=1 Tax=Lipomyces starkeyi NRRL Y-11557 TaxID=675824 RepID=A0A1E3PVJ9_LIPST|nr:hypothetical protein LIPSTDRAFT_76086 [Lipomyces starkeyi NRRL Y-11557]